VSLTERGENHFQCTATLAEREVKRYTPAGIPIVAARLLHVSEQVEAGTRRQVEFEVAVIAAGEIADQLERAEMGKMFRFTGFMARKNRNSKSLVFHLSAIETIY
jgi:primosomal replication protein N